ncbi:MAG: NAD(P)H-hydrate dehydratase [Eggerthellaceae bacterium]|nr:NAD(P)H-hydrate dehydratase [Eggerthellaceae bacterium]
MGPYDKNGFAALLPWPAADAHKYSRGKLILVAGSPTYPGAACLAACASQKAGAGYTEVVTAPRAIQVIQVCRPSLVVRSWDDIYNEELQMTTRKNPCAYVLGPGFEAGKKTTLSLSYFILGKAKAPVLVDGGALSTLNTSGGLALCRGRHADGFSTVITPHAGEAQQLVQGYDIPLDDPAGLASLLSFHYGVVTVLKGPVTYVSNGEATYALTQGTSALAKAGTGDVLSGIIGALLAQGLDAMDAAVLGTTLHGKAGSLAAEDLTSICVCAEDVISYLPKAIRFFADAVK